eukprot:g1388.t1
MQLEGKRVLITAPRQYASKLSSILVRAGARPIWLPTIQITSLPKAELPNIDNALEKLDQFSHVAFTSKNGISAVIERLQHLKHTQEDLVKYVHDSNVKLCALGADSEELEKHGMTADIKPVEASTTGLVKELTSRNQLTGSNILCPIPSVRGGLKEPIIIPRFLEMLRQGGAEVTPLAVYITQMGIRPEQCKAERQLLQEGSIDVIVFTSSAEVLHLPAIR